MRVRVKVPKLGLTMTEATIREWLKSVGDAVTAGEPLVIIETEKADVEIESPASGRLVEILGAVTEVCPVGAAIAVIDTPGA